MIRSAFRRLPWKRGALLLPALATLAGAAPANAQDATVRGTVSYEKVIADSGGLRLNAPVRRPAGGVKVEVVAMPGKAVLGTAFTDTAGAYSIPVRLRNPSQLFVRALARTENASVVRVSDRSPYLVASPPVDAAPGGTLVRDLLATDSTRVSGAFNIAVVVARANAVVRAAQPGATLPDIEIRWAPTYDGDTYYGESQDAVFLKGMRGDDSDEFDDHVVAHEYGHVLMAAFSRDPSPGGDHGFGERLDPRLAWSEGWSNFFAAVVTGSPRFVDTGGGKQPILLSMNLEENAPTGDRPGIWSEHSVASALWDWFDAGVEEGDSVALGFAPLWRAFTGMRSGPDPYLLRFADALGSVSGNPARIASTLAARGIVPGAAEAEGGEPGAFPMPLAPGDLVRGTVDSRTTRRSNLWRSSAHYAIVLADSAQVSVTLKIVQAHQPTRADLDLYIYDSKGEVVASSTAVNGVGDSERIVRRLGPGEYRVEVRSWSNESDSRLADRFAHQGSYSLIARY